VSLNAWEEALINPLALQIEDLDALSSSSAEPIPVRTEDEGVDGAAGLQRVQVLSIVEVPEHCYAILAT
jgi:hypothetical protein